MSAIAEQAQVGHRLLVHPAHRAIRNLPTGRGAIEVRTPRVDDRREGGRGSSRILPRDPRRVPSLENLIPALYFKGISTSAMPAAVAHWLGQMRPERCQHRRAGPIAGWQEEAPAVSKRDLREEEIVCPRAEGIYGKRASGRRSAGPVGRETECRGAGAGGAITTERGRSAKPFP